MTRTNEMTNPQARRKHRTTAQIPELCLQAAEDYHQQQLSDTKIIEDQAVGYSREVQQPCRPTPTSSDQPRLASCIDDRHATRSRRGSQSGNCNGPRPVNRGEPRAGAAPCRAGYRAPLSLVRPSLALLGRWPGRCWSLAGRWPLPRLRRGALDWPDGWGIHSRCLSPVKPRTL
jgi:hypothetical protein